MLNKIQKYKIDFPNLCSFICILSVTFSKTFTILEPNFYFGKYNFFQTTSITLTEVIILICSLVFLIYKYKKQEKLTADKTLTLFLFYIFLINPTTLSLTAIGFSVLLINTNTQKNIKYFISCIILQATLAIYQFIFQTNTKLSALTFIGEPNLNINTKGISKVRLNEFEILRSYGTTMHPNMLAGMIATASLITNKVKTKSFLLTSLLAPASISSALCIIAANIYKTLKQKKNILTLVAILAIIIPLTLFRLSDTNFESTQFRANQTNAYLTENSNFKELLIGTNKSQPTNQMLPWEIQPIHNSYLYVLTHYGIICLLILIFTLTKLIKQFTELGIFLSTILLFDHFWFTTASGLLLFTFIYTIGTSLHKEIRISG